MKVIRKATYYTDGACSGNPGAGGWAYVEVLPCDSGIKTNIVTGTKKDTKKEISGGKDNTTNNIMELTAVIEGLKLLKFPCKVKLYSDSAYVVNAIAKEWLLNWKENGWLTKEGKSIKNKQIWEKMYKLLYVKNINAKMVKVKGHKDDVLNELADKSAVQAKQRAMEE